MSDIIDLSAAERRMQGAVDAVRSNFATIRTGRANPSLLDRIEVEAYGTKMDLRSVANVGVPEPTWRTFTPSTMRMSGWRMTVRSSGTTS